jgi:hypothetical protein
VYLLLRHRWLVNKADIMCVYRTRYHNCTWGYPVPSLISPYPQPRFHRSKPSTKEPTKLQQPARQSDPTDHGPHSSSSYSSQRWSNTLRSLGCTTNRMQALYQCQFDPRIPYALWALGRLPASPEVVLFSGKLSAVRLM